MPSASRVGVVAPPHMLYRAYRGLVMRGSSMCGSSHNNVTMPANKFGEPANWGGLLGHPECKRIYIYSCPNSGSYVCNCFFATKPFNIKQLKLSIITNFAQPFNHSLYQVSSPFDFLPPFLMGTTTWCPLITIAGNSLGTRLPKT